MKKIKKKDGFLGERAIVLPRKTVEHIRKRDINNMLYITDIGYYPKAAFHYRMRKNGAEQNILIYCTSGKGWCKIERGSYLISPNQFLIIPENIPHTYGANENDPWTIYWVHFSGLSAKTITYHLFKKFLSGDNFVVYDDYRIHLFDLMYSQLEHGYGLQTSGYAGILLWHFLGSFLYPGEFSNNNKLQHADPISTSIQYMRDHLHERISLADLAGSCCLSVSHFSSLFKQKTGYAPIEYLLHLKIQKACQLLQFTDMRIKEISNSIGIDDPFYFSRLFTKVMNISPRAFRLSKTVRR